MKGIPEGVARDSTRIRPLIVQLCGLSALNMTVRILRDRVAIVGQARMRNRECAEAHQAERRPNAWITAHAGVRSPDTVLDGQRQTSVHVARQYSRGGKLRGLL